MAGRSAPGAVAPAVAALASAVIPGLGQIRAGHRDRGLVVLASAAAIVGVLVWLGQAWPWVLAVPFWLAQVLDAAALAAGRGSHTARLALLGALPIYVASWRATEASVGSLVTGFPKVEPLFRGLVSPDFLTRASLTDVTARVQVLTPCPKDAAAPAEAPLADDSPSVSVSPACAPLGSGIAVTGSGFPAAGPVHLVWVGPTGERAALGDARTDSDGRFAAMVVVPVSSIPQNVRERRGDVAQRQNLEVVAPGPPGPVRPSPTLGYVLAAMGVTIALGYMATLLGALIAVPFAVLGARNLMSANRAAFTVYMLVRTAMNVLRSIEPLILAVVFVVWVKQGPFAGVLALTAHTVAALGKLFSESIEDIDPGPVEAVRSTGARWLQTVAYAVLPQVVPSFTAFTVYRWDINVRMSTIVGFVGGGGIGMLLQQWIFKGNWREAATAVLVIALVVIALDFVSAAARQRITDGRALVPARLKWPALAALALFTVWAWQTAEIRPVELATGAPKIRGIAGELLRPDLLDRDTASETAQAPLVVPCALEADGVSAGAPGSEETAGLEGAAGPASATGSPWTAPLAGAARDEGPALSLAATCADAGDRVAVAGSSFAADATVRVRWRLPDGRTLQAARARTDENGRFGAEVEVRPLLAQQGEAARAPMVLEAVVTEAVGAPRPSKSVRSVVDQLVLTVLMALLATTLGALFALPLAFAGARNIMPASAVGNLVYYGSRMFMNILRAVEPLILAAVFAAWVGYGTPFAGVMALVLVTVANLGKLFSEAVESIEPGPLEAIEATGADRAQTVAYGVVPQVVPPFLSFGIYTWDINVRISTVIGFVGGGGVGFVLKEWMNQLQWSAAAVAILGIVVVVATMDWLSARLRERMV